MYKKFFLGFSLVALLSNLSVAYAVDVWSSSNKVTGEWNEVEKLWGYYFVDALSNSKLLKELDNSILD